VAAFRNSLQPLRQTLKSQKYLGGDAPSYADYIVFGSLQWARCASPFQILAEDDILFSWFSGQLDLFDGFGRKAPGYPA
jgi:glutathione S-transferase